MNYRQWKKNYKKRYGYNPPLEDDKRKQIKYAKKVCNTIHNYDFSGLVDNLIKGIGNTFEIIGTAFINYGKSLKNED